MLPLFASLVGLTAWSGSLACLPIATLFPAVWTASRSRWQGGLVAAAYYLSAARGLPKGATTYFDAGVYSGIILWLAAGAILSALYLVLWHPRRPVRIGMIPLVLFLASVPPFGVVGWVNPLTAAGSLFPGCGWFGLGLMLFVVMTLAALPPFFTAAISTGAALFLSQQVIASTPPPFFWKGMNTHFVFESGSRDYYQDYLRQLELMKMAQASPANVTVFPESTAGLWNETTKEVWRPLQKKLGDRSVLIGAEEIALHSKKTENVLLHLRENESKIIYYQRMPVPVSMWRPWDADGTKANWFANPVFEVNGVKAAALICYEQLLMWPVLHSLWHRPEVLIAIGNDWWAADTSIPGIQLVTVTAWARLFDTQLVTAYNY